LEKGKKNFTYYMRALHRDIGFFVIGLTLIYALSGIILNYRDTDFMKTDVEIINNIEKNLSVEVIPEYVSLRKFTYEKTENNIYIFNKGSYNPKTGELKYKVIQYIYPFNKFIELHKTYSENINHWFVTIYGVLLVFLALSSFWMYKLGTKNFKRGIIIAIIGFVSAIIILII